MRIYGHRAAADGQGSSPDALAEVTLVASSDELRRIAGFLLAAAEGMETRGPDWEHEHLSDRFPEFEDAPRLVVFNPRALSDHGDASR